VPDSVAVLRVELNRGICAVRESIRKKGVLAAATLVASTAASQLAFPVIAARRRDRRFTFQGEQLPYTLHRYNCTYRNERTVEISIARWFLAAGRTGRMLEVGNVLAHYGVTGHTVVDKYETVAGVLNQDIIGYTPDHPFDTVVAISTLEHIGWDDEPREPEKVLQAIDAVRCCVAPGGRLLVTLPIGYNPMLDDALRSGAVQMQRETWLVRENRSNDWRETDRDEALGREYGRPFRNANALCIGTEHRRTAADDVDSRISNGVNNDAGNVDGSSGRRA
jgi:hypothetical protein